MKRTDYPVGRSGAFRMGEGHAFIGRGLVYCPSSKEAAAPVVTHSRVKCALCGKTIQSAVNPPSRAHLRKDVRAFDRMMGELKRLKARDLRRKNSPTTPVAHFLRRGMMEGQTPAQAFRAVARQFAGRVPRAALRGAFNAVRAELMGGLEGDRTGMSDWAGKAAMRMSTYKKFSRNPVGWALIGAFDTRKEAETFANRVRGERGVEDARVKQHPFPATTNKPWTVEGWGNWQVEAFRPRRKNPGRGPVKIYGKTEKIFMTKTEGPYKGERFVHDFKPGVEQHGLPRGTIITTPDGKNFKLTTRSVVMTGKKDLWRNFPA